MQSFACLGGLQNYEDDPVLAKAIEFDLEMNGGDLDKADRAMAEKYYLEYLQTPRESFQLAHVYSQLGALYAVAFNRIRGESPDYEKATFYLMKVLEMEPHRIGDSTIRARSLMSSVVNSGPHRIKSDGELYVFLRTVDANAVAHNWLPRRPGDTPGTDAINLSEMARSIEGSICRNMKYFAERVSNSDLEPVLREILTKAPGTDLAAVAIEILRERGLEPPVAVAARAEASPLTASVPSPAPVEETVHSDASDGGLVAVVGDSQHGGSPYLWVVAAVAVVAVAAGILLLKKKVFRSRDSTS